MLEQQALIFMTKQFADPRLRIISTFLAKAVRVTA